MSTFAGKSGQGTHVALDGFLDRRDRDHAKGLAIAVVRARGRAMCGPHDRAAFEHDPTLERRDTRRIRALKNRMVERIMIQQRLSNEELLSTLSATWREEGVLVARTIVMLMEVEDRRLHLELACSSMFDFCTRRLGMSEGEAFRRITAARLAKRFPPVLDAMRKQYVHLSSLVLLRELFTRENVDELLAAAAGKTKRAVQELVAKLAPRPDVPASIRKLPPARAFPTATTTPTTTATATTSAPTTTTNATPTATATGLPWPLPDALPIAGARVVATPTSTPSAPPRDIAGQLVPLAEARHKVQFTASSALREKLERAQSLLRHRNIDGDLAVVVERALDVLIAKLEKEKLAATPQPRSRSRSPSTPSPTATPPGKDRAEGKNRPPAASPQREGKVSHPVTTTTVRAAVRREVMKRDGAQCTFVGLSGERCPARTLLELDHRHPRALGGGSGASNLRILCRAHNHYAAERAFGREHIADAIERDRAKRGGDPDPSPSS